MPPDELSSGPVLDLRTYRVVSGGREAFERLFLDGSLPMLRRHGIEVVGFGPSLADEVHYFLARAFSSAAERERLLASFYGSNEWKQRYEGPVLELIESYHTVVIALTPDHQALRDALTR